jgi:hypothetical protein
VGEACCGRAAVSLAVFSDEPADGLGDGDTPIDARISAPDLYLRQERSGHGDGRVYLIAATATYEGVSSTRCTTVVVPKSQSERDRESAKRQACAARAFCGVADGPPGFHLVGSGPLVRTNQPPVVDAGPDQAIDLGAPAALHGTVTDDGLPSGSVTQQWSLVAGPGAVTFMPPDAAQTTAAFPAAGSYRLRLTADDSALQASDEVVVVVSAANAAPVVDAGPDQAIALPTTTATLTGVVSDDGRPGPTLSVAWSFVEGPGTVTFSAPNQAVTLATFGAIGQYRLRLSASDGQFTVADDVRVTLDAEPPPFVAIADASVAEGSEGTVGSLVDVQLSKPWLRPVQVDYVTVDGTATSPCDYRRSYGTLGFAPGETVRSVLVPVVGD